MSVATGRDYSTQRMQVVADNIEEACTIAESTFPGYKVHHGWCIADGRPDQTDEALEAWLSEHRKAQGPGSNGER